ncbi:hypothetical protein EZV62_024014 [Acer yangbiense]|uniref:Chromo domain-containing protein n=1 Tax=Acer yangbiense TaxID=1000413 RepID=A0A5C7H3B3_9ROSI|nr:hypothetical protein EZV62_024014 [Acer yangbiense]
MKKYVNQHHRSLEFKVDDKVLLKLIPQMWKRVTNHRYHKGLIQRYDGPFIVKEWVRNVAYSFSKAQQRQAPPVIRVEFEKAVEKILDHHMVDESNLNWRTDFLVQWKGESELEATWEHGATLWQFEDLVQAYQNNLMTRTSFDFGPGALSSLLNDAIKDVNGIFTKSFADTLTSSLVASIPSFEMPSLHKDAHEVNNDDKPVEEVQVDSSAIGKVSSGSEKTSLKASNILSSPET